MNIITYSQDLLQLNLCPTSIDRDIFSDIIHIYKKINYLFLNASLKYAPDLLI